MSHLADHARAFRVLGKTIANRAEQMGDPTGVLTCLAEAYTEAAEMIDDEVRDGMVDHRCTVDHRTFKGPRCPACNAPKA